MASKWTLISRTRGSSWSSTAGPFTTIGRRSRMTGSGTRPCSCTGSSRSGSPGGHVHGGIWVAVADTVAAWGTMLRLGPGESFTTSELKVNVFAAATSGDELLATGEPLHVGRRSQVWEVRVQKDDRLAANFVCTQMILGPKL